MKKLLVCVLCALCLATVFGQAPKRILMVMSDRDFYDPEYTIPRAALEKLGYSIEVANASGGTSIGIELMSVKADMAIAQADASRYEALLLVGGYGAESLYNHPALMALSREFAASHKTIGAQCYAPVILAQAGLLQGEKATCWSTQQSKLSRAGAHYSAAVVEVSGFCVTGAGGSTAAIEAFSEAFVRNLKKPR